MGKEEKYLKKYIYMCVCVCVCVCITDSLHLCFEASFTKSSFREIIIIITLNKGDEPQLPQGLKILKLTVGEFASAFRVNESSLRSSVLVNPLSPQYCLICKRAGAIC